MKPQDPQKKEMVCEAAVSLTNKLGFSGISMSKIAKEAGVSPATLYIYYENKEDMINSLFLTLREEMYQYVCKGYTSSTPIKKTIQTLWYNTYAYINAHAEHFLYTDQYFNSPYITSAIRKKSKEQNEPVYRVIERGIQEGILKQLPVEVVQIMIFTPLFQILKGCFAEDIEVTDEILASTFDSIWEAIRYRE